MANTPVNPFPKAFVLEGGVKTQACAWIKVEVDFVSNWNASVNTWTDVTNRIRFTPDGGISWRRGRDDEFQDITPGTIEITFNNLDRAFDPSFTGSPFWPNVDCARPLRVTLYWPTTNASDGQIVFYGQIEEWECHWAPGRDATCIATGVELFGALANVRIVAAAFLSLNVGDRLIALMQYAGIAPAHYNFTSGGAALQQQTYTQTDVLAACQECIALGGASFGQSQDGVIGGSAAFPSSGISFGTFGEKSGEIPYNDLIFTSGGAYNYTVVVITPSAGGSPAAANVDSTFVARYGSRAYSRTSAATTQATALSVAQSFASQIKAKGYKRVKQVMLKPMRSPNEIWPAVLQGTGASGSFAYLPPGGGPRFSQKAVVMGMDISIKRDVTVTWTLAPI